MSMKKHMTHRNADMALEQLVSENLGESRDSEFSRRINVHGRVLAGYPGRRGHLVTCDAARIIRRISYYDIYHFVDSVFFDILRSNFDDIKKIAC